MAGFAVITAVLANTVRAYRPELGMQVALAGGLVLLGFAVAELSGIAGAAREIMETAGLDGGTASLVFRIVGIAYTAQTAADICRDSGESSLAGKAELLGRLMIVQASLPALLKLVRLAADLAEEYL